MILHPLHTHLSPPERFTYPFCYEPHSLCVLAAEQVQAYIAAHPAFSTAADSGKMFGVLVVETPDEAAPLAFLAAYSGLLANRNDWDWFVPPVYDAQQPDGWYKTHEAEITRINHEITALENDPLTLQVRRTYAEAKQQAVEAIASYQTKVKSAKVLRDIRRLHHNLSPEENAELIRESQFLKAELHRLKKLHEQTVAQAAAPYTAIEQRLKRLKQQRKELSDQLQRWLFSQYRLLNARGEERSVMEIFNPDNPAVAASSQGKTPANEESASRSLSSSAAASNGCPPQFLLASTVISNEATAQKLPSNTAADSCAPEIVLPPAAIGDCCAPKLLQYAFAHHLKPRCMAEFWWGQSPKMEVRHHLHYYPACRGRCLPLLSFMLQGLDVDPNPLEQSSEQPLPIVYEDEWLLVVNKPAGMLSVPGKLNRPSVESLVRQRLCNGKTPLIVHRLDMETSGLMVVAKTKEAHEQLQQQFENRQVEKQYIALLEGIPAAGHRISLPLRADLLDRPRQVVDFEHGKTAVTDYEIVSIVDGGARVALYPHTGRTHQLRVHCAHPLGLGIPIVGDALYGKAGSRLCLHAARLTFTHPATGQRLTFEQAPDFLTVGA